MTFCASSMRPAALMRGAIWKATWRALGDAAVQQPGNFQHGAQAGILGLIQPFQAVLDDDAILADQRHHVGHGRDGHQLQERLQHARQLLGRPSERGEQRMHQLEGDARAAQVLVGIAGSRGDSDSARRARAEARRRADDDR